MCVSAVSTGAMPKSPTWTRILMETEALAFSVGAQRKKLFPSPNVLHLTLQGQWSSPSPFRKPKHEPVGTRYVNECVFTPDIDPPPTFMWEERNFRPSGWRCISDSSPFPRISTDEWEGIRESISEMEWVERVGSGSGKEWVVWLPDGVSASSWGREGMVELLYAYPNNMFRLVRFKADHTKDVPFVYPSSPYGQHLLHVWSVARSPERLFIKSRLACPPTCLLAGKPAHTCIPRRSLVKEGCSSSLRAMMDMAYCAMKGGGGEGENERECGPSVTHLVAVVLKIMIM